MLIQFARWFCKPVQNRQGLYFACHKNIHTTKRLLKTYEGEGKMTANILNNEEDVGLMIDGYSQAGFRLNNGITVLGSVAIFPRSVLSWNVNHVSDITEKSLALFPILEPKLEIIVIGIGDKTEERSFYQKILPFIKKHKMNLEVSATDIACSTFNFLNSEGRYVAAVLIPPQNIKTTDDDMMETKLRYHNLYEVQD